MTIEKIYLSPCMGLSGCVIDSVCGRLKVYIIRIINIIIIVLRFLFNTLGDRFIPKCIRPGGNDNIALSS